MSVIKTMLFVALIGLACWLIVTYVPMPTPFPMIVIIAGVVGAIVLIVRAYNLTLP